MAIIGVLTYGKVEGIIYLFFSFLYTQKIKKLGPISPLLRGLQSFFIVAGIIGYTSPITYIAGGLLLIRNLAGDFRDIEKDKKEDMKTVPVLLGMNKNMPHIHLIFTLFTSAVWWYISSVSVGWLILVIFIEVATYNLTPR